jgi:hypothetical protein
VEFQFANDSGEITTGGLARADATTKTHTRTNVSTLQETFSATHTNDNVVDIL